MNQGFILKFSRVNQGFILKFSRVYFKIIEGCIKGNREYWILGLLWRFIKLLGTQGFLRGHGNWKRVSSVNLGLSSGSWKLEACVKC